MDDRLAKSKAYVVLAVVVINDYEDVFAYVLRFSLCGDINHSVSDNVGVGCCMRMEIMVLMMSIIFLC